MYYVLKISYSGNALLSHLFNSQIHLGVFVKTAIDYFQITSGAI